MCVCVCVCVQATKFLNRADVQADLGVDMKWKSCSEIPHLVVSYFEKTTSSRNEGGRIN